MKPRRNGSTPLPLNNYDAVRFAPLVRRMGLGSRRRSMIRLLFSQLKGGGGPPMRSEVYRYFPYPLSYRNRTEQVESVVSVRVAGASVGKPCGRMPSVEGGSYRFQECDYRAKAESQRPLLHEGLTRLVHGPRNIRPTSHPPLQRELIEFRGPLPVGKQQGLSYRGRSPWRRDGPSG